MASKNKCRKYFIVCLKLDIVFRKTNHGTVNAKIATEKFPRVFLCISICKNVVTCDSI